MADVHGASPDEWGHWSIELDLTADLLPVVSNPTAQISPGSTMGAIGKTPSRYNARRCVSGFPDWTSYRATDENVAAWSSEPDYGICLQTRRVRAIDIDVPGEVDARAIEQTIAAHVDLPARRRVDSEKFLLLVQIDTDEDLRKRRIKTGSGIIEFLANGQQCVVAGRHPAGARYEWPAGLPNAIPTISLEQFERLWSELETQFAIEPSHEAKPTVTKAQNVDGAIHADPVAEHLLTNGWVLSIARRGELNVRCPWEEEHTTDTGETAARYWPAHTGGYALGHFKCLHAHCEHRGRGEFVQAIGFNDGDFEDLTQAPDDAKRRPWTVVPAAEFVANARPTDWLIDDLIPRAELGVVFGESGSGKSFFVLDLAAAIARGVPWRERATLKARIGIVVAEGVGGFRNRLLALARHLGIELRDLPILILAETPNLLAEDHRRIATAFDAAGGVDFLVIDTLAQSMPGGNESSSEDMGRVIARCRALHHATGAMVLLVHHAGKDATRGARGWSGLRAACDLEIEIVRDGGAREAIVTKLKDGEDGARFGFELRTVMLDGDETSCVAVPREGALLRQPGRERPMGAQEIRVVDLLIAMGGSSRKADLVEAAGKEPATSDDARTPSRRREDARRAIKSLARRGAITCDTGGFITNRTETIANA